ncbi:MAG: hypothetical protein Q9183_006262, partial [Haloplaca sp. 2 TL-2023]
MQRAAAAAGPSATPPETPDSPSSKRRKTSQQQASPATEADIYEAAAKAEDAKRVAAIERIAAEAGETKWVLSTADRNGVTPDNKVRFLTTGYSDIDQETPNTGSRLDQRGRRSFGRFNRELEKQQDPDANSSSISGDSSSEEQALDDGDTDADSDSTEQLLRQNRRDKIRQTKAEAKARRKAEKAEVSRRQKEVEERRHKVVKLSNLSSISGGKDKGTGGREKGGGGIGCHA